jgi:ATP synthase protein I
MADLSDEERLRRLKERIAAARGEQEPAPKAQDHHSQAHLAWRMVIELVAGLMVGFGIGMGLDALFGTRPIMLVLFILLGFAAGVRTMLRTAQEISTGNDAKAGAPDAAENEEDGRRG